MKNLSLTTNELDFIRQLLELEEEKIHKNQRIFGNIYDTTGEKQIMINEIKNRIEEYQNGNN